MGLVKSIKSSVHGDLLRNVYETIQYLTIDDLEGTGLLEAPTGSPRPPGSREYLHLLSTTVALGRLRSALFQIILVKNQLFY